jgi:hypothetical protein
MPKPRAMTNMQIFSEKLIVVTAYPPGPLLLLVASVHRRLGPTRDCAVAAGQTRIICTPIRHVPTLPLTPTLFRPILP